MGHLELSGVLLNLAFLIGIINRKIWAWWFGIAGSLTGAYYFATLNYPLYAESGLYLFYAVMGFWGWHEWKKHKNEDEIMPVKASVTRHYLWLVIGFVIWISLGFVLDRYTNSDYAYFDSFTTVFAVIATFMEIKRWLRVWHYWIVINGASIFLYFLKGSMLYSGLAVVYTIVSVIGWLEWEKKYSATVTDMERQKS
jgi:nicotinamide mononucleotide transporter